MSLINSVNDRWFINLSKSPIPHDIQSLLQLNEKFNLPFHHNSQRFAFNFIKNIEYNIQKLDLDTASNIRCLSVQTLNKLLSSPPTPSIIDSRLIALTIKTKEFLTNYPNIFVTKADKGNVTVALDKHEYLDKMKNLLLDTETYIEVNCDLTKKTISKLKVLLQHWLKKRLHFTQHI